MDGHRKRVCLLTGASGTLGSEFCRRHAGSYHIVAVTRSRPVWVTSQVRRVVDPLNPGVALGRDTDAVHEVRVDLDSESGLEHAVDVALARFGRVDVLVTAAVHYGFARMDDPRFPDLAMEQYWTNSVMPVRLAMVLAQRAWKGPETSNQASRRGVIHVSSTSAFGRSVGTHQAGYAASKAALNVLIAHQADEMRPFGVRVNGLAPGSFGPQLPVSSVADRIVEIDGGSGSGEVTLMEPAR
jgi:NAD(P)-dependent dehydrogenase (short-subunit alcohol dehydrogenase family)